MDSSLMKCVFVVLLVRDPTVLSKALPVPDEVHDFSAAVNNSSIITLFWSPSEHQAGPTNYTIVVNGNIDDITDNCIEVEVLNVEGYNTSSAVVTNLCSYTFYNFTIMASTSAGNSSIVSLNQTVQTGIGTPEEPNGFNASVNNSSTVILFWSPCKHQTGPTNYTIAVHGNVDQVINSCTHEDTLNIKGYTTSSTVVTNLCSYTLYNFTIMARTSAGNSSSVALNRTVKTGIGIPGEPTDFYATLKNSSTITLFWSASKHQAGTTNYSIAVNGSVDNKTENCTVTEVINVQGFNTSCVVVANLCSYTFYHFTIMAITSAGNSSSVAVNKAVKTGNGIPDEPTDFGATVNNSSTITLYWSPSEHQAGSTNYSIVVNGSVDNKMDNCTVSEVMNVQGYNISSTVVANLCSYTLYNFTIMASTSAGNSKSVAFDQTVKTEIGRPGEPTDFGATVNNSSTITLFWSPSEHQAGPTNYSIVVNGSVDNKMDNCTVSEVMNVQGYNTSSKVVANLCSYTLYNFTIMASTTAGNSKSVALNQTVKTEIGIPAEPTNFHATVNSSSTITLFWSPSKHLAGPTNYSIVVNGNEGNRTNDCIETEVITIEGYETSSVVVDNLCSYTYYNFTIMASTSARNSLPVGLNHAVQTGYGVPDAPRNIFATSVSPYTVKLSWTPAEHRAGPTSYLVEVEGSGLYKNVQSLKVQGFNKSSLIVQDLLSYTNYKLTIRTITSAGESYTMDTTVRTQSEAADPPQKLKVENVTPSSVELSWMPSKHQCGLTEYIVEVEEQSHLKDEFYVLSRTITVHGFHSNTVDIANLTSYWKYRFSVRAKTAVHPDSTQINAEIKTMQSPPGRVKNIQVSALPDNYTAVKLTWECPEEKERHGPISNFTVQYSDKVYTFAHFPDEDPCSDIHVATLPVEPEHTYTFVVVATAEYEGLKSNSHPFNAKRKPPSTETPSPTDPTQGRPAASFIVPRVVGGLLAALVSVGLVVAGLLLRRRRFRNDKNVIRERPDGEEVEEIENCVDNIRPMKICDFPEFVDDYHKIADLQFSREWREFSQSSRIHPSIVASLEINRQKNCYVNILAYDHTRVKLLPKTLETGSDYINANYIPGYSGPQDYIASQGPVVTTVEDFWQMIWEQNVPVIVQLTDLYEKGKKMFAQYWPDNLSEGVLYGDIAVELLDRSINCTCSIKAFKVSLRSETRIVKHLYLQDWQPNKLTPEEMIKFSKYVRSELEKTNQGPMVVHCSAGVGRTGTFICVDYFLQVIDKADLEDSIDIFSFVLKMRGCRPLMVQSLGQYVFVHDVVKEMILAKMKKSAAEMEEEEEPENENTSFA